MITGVLSRVLSKVLYIGVPYFLKKARVRFDHHAEYRLAERSELFGLAAEESRRRVLVTIMTGRVNRHGSKVTYYRFFHDNLTYYVIGKEYRNEVQRRVFVKTSIIKRGRP
jgi:hypothetical protein